MTATDVRTPGGRPDLRKIPVGDLLAVSLRWAAVVGTAVWLGGFTFYSAFVIPVLHEAMGDLDAGDVTRQVTVVLNWLAAASLAAWGVLLWAERKARAGWAVWVRLALVAADAAALASLFAMHPVLSSRLATGPRRAFFPLHEVYLSVSTAQWGINLALLAVSLWVWRRADGAANP